MRETLRHCVAAAAFACLAIVWSYPLVRHLSTHLPGGGIGDNALFLWNFWWMRMALASGTDFFRTSYLFAPVGADLTLHTHTAFTAWIGANWLGRLPVVAALNVTILLALALNGFCAYLLAWRLTRDWGAALVAGLIFGSSPYISSHLNGHFNLTSAWTIPLFVLAVSPAVAGAKRWALLAGVLLAVTAYIDYYYLVYEVTWTLVVLALAATTCSVSFRPKDFSFRWFAIVGVVIVVDVMAIVAIGVTGGLTAQIGPLRISMRDTYNPLQLLWAAAGLALLIRIRPHVRFGIRDSWSWRRAVPALATMGGACLLAIAPLVWKGLQLMARGQYVTQQYYWRSAPTGVDAATLMFGNPFQGLWGSAVQRLYAVGAGINLIESGAWLGVVPIMLAFYALRSRIDGEKVREWTVMAAVFFVWALGPHLMVLGRSTGMILPQTILRYVPVGSNARIPGRAMIMVYLALAMLAAIGAADWSRRYTRPAVVLLAIGIMVFVDFLPAPFPTAAIDCPSIYQVLRDRPERGALAELPLGFGDGLNALTPVDHHMLVCQMTHERPLVGGVLARIPANVLPAYQADPLLASWLRLSGAPGQAGEIGPLPDAILAGKRLRADDVAFVMLNRETASPQLRDYVEHVMPLTVIAQEQNRVLYQVNR